MRLRYLKLRNILSFGDGEVNLDFDSLNIIAGPNNAGKTNLFRALNIIGKSFDLQQWQEEMLFQGDLNKPLHLEVGLELDENECELLSTIVICSEIIRIQGQPDQTKEIVADKRWKSILINYGEAVLSKSFRHLSIVLHRGELRISESRFEVLLSQQADKLYIDTNGYLSKTSRDQRIGYQVSYLAKELMEDFHERFKEISDPEIETLLQQKKKLLQESPELTTLLKGKLEDPTRMVSFQGFGSLQNYSNYLATEPLLNKLLLLIDAKEIKADRPDFLVILGQIYKKSFIELKELRFSNAAMTSPISPLTSQETEIVGTDLALTLFKMMTAVTQKDRQRYNLIRESFHNLTDLDFQIAIRGKDMEVISDEVGVRPPETTSESEFFPLVYKHKKTKRKLSEAFVQIIKANYPISIEETASGIHEILLLLTAIIGESEKVVLLDEPELHLHPQMQKKILELISKSKNEEKNQILLITHSPYLTSAEEINSTWRFSATDTGTKVHNVGEVISELQNVLEENKQKQISIKLSSPDIRSILFSQGVILVEGPSDKIVVEQIDRFLSEKGKGANLDENEWSIIDMNTKSNLTSFMLLSKMLGVSCIAILDFDALMHVENYKIKLNGKKVQTSAVFSALWLCGKLDPITVQSLVTKNPKFDDWYNSSDLESFKKVCFENGVFIFSKDLEGAMQTSATRSDSKPLKALEKILERIKRNDIPPELLSMCDFIKAYLMN